MLESIHIENIALIKNMDICLTNGFSAFTGETGAGKSIIIDSIGCLCGNKISKELIRNGEDTAIVEGIFSFIGKNALYKCSQLSIYPDEDGVIYVSRSVRADGKSNVKINGKTVPLSILREISKNLINIHGQHDNTELINKESHRKILDAYGEINCIFDKYTTAYTNYCSIKKQLDLINIDESEKQRQIEILKFQINDIAELKLKPGEEETLFEEKNRLVNIEKIARNSSIITQALNGAGTGASECIDRAAEALRSLSKISEEYSQYRDELLEAKSKIIDIAEIVSDMAGSVDGDPTLMLDKIENRLAEIQKAKRKYGNDIEQILEFFKSAKEKLDELENADRKSQLLREQLSLAGKELKNAGAQLTHQRTLTADILKTNIEEQMKYLDMPQVKFKVSINTKAYGKDGADDIEFLIMTNSGEGFSPLSKTASGGELSRIMLAIKSVIAEKDGIDTLIFDEVDTGISGKTSRKIGLKLGEISKNSQVLCVTHSAQICSIADTHYRVSKYTERERTYTKVDALSAKARIDETARIIAGINITQSSLDAAKELIESKTL